MTPQPQSWHKPASYQYDWQVFYVRDPSFCFPTFLVPIDKHVDFNQPTISRVWGPDNRSLHVGVPEEQLIVRSFPFSLLKDDSHVYVSKTIIITISSCAGILLLSKSKHYNAPKNIHLIPTKHAKVAECVNLKLA